MIDTEIKIPESRFVQLLERERESEEMYRHLLKNLFQDYLNDVGSNGFDPVNCEQIIRAWLTDAKIFFNGDTANFFINSTNTLMYWGYKDSAVLLTYRK